MPKRHAEALDGVSTKRVKHEGDRPEVVSIESSKQLQRLLHFDQDAIPQLQEGFSAFKVFLDSIVYAEDKLSTHKQQLILKQYLDSQTPDQSDDASSEKPFLSDFFQLWSLAASVYNDSLLSTVPATLALLLKTLSGFIELSDHGLRLGRAVLAETPLKLIEKQLNGPKHKEYLISPCLRLLTEVLSFDGGALARNTYAAKSVTLDPRNLVRNLSVSKQEPTVPAKRGPTVRSNAIRYLLAALKFLNTPAKSDLLRHGQVWKTLFEHLVTDSEALVKETLDTIKTHVLLDRGVSRRDKIHLLTENNLANIAKLYRQDDSSPDLSIFEASNRQSAHDFLVFACTSPVAGIYRKSTGWYTDATSTQTLSEFDVDTTGEEEHTKPIRNELLSKFLLTLRPYSDPLQADLVRQVFNTAPELLSEYFIQRASFSFDPKLSVTWIGYFVFLFSALRLPIPAYFGHSYDFPLPPPISTTLDSILPRPLNQKVLTRCLHQSVGLITFFTLQLVIAALEKLQATIKAFEEAAERHGSQWRDAAQDLKGAFISRCPSMKDIISAYRSTPADRHMQREAVLRLLAKYYSVLPALALEEKLDVSIPLANAFQSFNNDIDETKETNADQNALDLQHLIAISRYSPSMDWWHRPKQLKYSTFTTLLKLIVTSKDNSPLGLKSLLEEITLEQEILQQETTIPATTALVESLKPYLNWTPSESIFTFFDDCCIRLKRAIPYEDKLEALRVTTQTSGPLSLLHVVLQEQWSYALARDGALDIASWIGRFVAASQLIGEDSPMLSTIIQDMVKTSDKLALKPSLKASIRKNLLEPKISNIEKALLSSSTSSGSKELTIEEIAPKPTELAETATPTEGLRGLHAWEKADAATSIEDGNLSALIYCLNSEYPEVRSQAVANLSRFASALSASRGTYPDWQQIHLLLSELIGTVSPIIASGPLPGLLTSFTTHMLTILTRPTDLLYPRINRFLTRAPTWNINRLPAYWVSQILHQAPDKDYTTTSTASSYNYDTQSTNILNLPSFYAHFPASNPNDKRLTFSSLQPLRSTSFQTQNQIELTWLLSALTHGLRHASDFTIIRRPYHPSTSAQSTSRSGTTIAEPLLALCFDPSLPLTLKERVLDFADALIHVEGGADFLITRAGGWGWAEMLLSLWTDSDATASLNAQARTRITKYDTSTESTATKRKHLVARVQKLQRDMWEHCDQERIREWSSGFIGPVSDT